MHSWKGTASPTNPAAPPRILRFPTSAARFVVLLVGGLLLSVFPVALTGEQATDTSCAVSVLSGLAGQQDAPSGTWTTGPEMPTARYGLGAVVIDGLIYAAAGGWYDFTFRALDSLEVFDPVEGSWSRRQPLLNARYGLAATVVEGILYCLGGENGSRLVTWVEGFDPATGEWSYGAQMAVPRRSPAAVEREGSIYCFGGYNRGVVAFADVYSPEWMMWSRLPDLPTARRGLAAAGLNDLIYCVGGEDAYRSLATLEIFDPELNVWTSGPDMPTARHGLAAVALEGKLYCIGGYNSELRGDDSFLNTVEIYDPATQSWSTGPPMPTPRYQLAAVVCGGRIYCLGGSNAESNMLTTVEILTP